MDMISPLRFSIPPQAMMPSADGVQDLSSPKFIQPEELQQLGTSASAPTPVEPTQSSSSFQNILGDFVNEVSVKQATASDAVNGLLTGKNVSLNTAVISMEEASVSFQMMVEVRNKLLDSYQEMMRMQV
jgi:flagellar hook-basal body complex protein FliE